MPRNGSNIYSAPPGTTASTLTPIGSGAYNSLVNDLVADANLARPIVAGGTGATTAAAARTNLGATTVGSAVFTATDAAAAQAAMSAQLPAGLVMHFIGLAAPSGWVLLNGGSIGNASSGATTRANSDTAALFTVLWDAIPTAVVQNSSGVVVARGASAAADYAANRRLVLLDARGEFLRGMDAGRGVDSLRSLGSAQAGAMENHTHSGTTSAAGAHAHNPQTGGAFLVGGLAGGAAGFTAGSNYQPTGQASLTNTEPNHTHTITTGNPSTGGGTETRPRNIALMVCAKL